MGASAWVQMCDDKARVRTAGDSAYRSDERGEPRPKGSGLSTWGGKSGGVSWLWRGTGPVWVPSR